MIPEVVHTLLADQEALLLVQPSFPAKDLNSEKKLDTDCNDFTGCKLYNRICLLKWAQSVDGNCHAISTPVKIANIPHGSCQLNKGGKATIFL